MLPEDKYFETLSEEELWQRYCGYFDLSIGEFTNIQERLLMDEVELVANSKLGKKIMKDNNPTSVEEFRRLVPLTTYEDYEPYLSERQDEVLAVKPLFWCHSAARGGRFKWIPYSSKAMEILVKHSIGILIRAASRRKGEINIYPGVRLFIIAPPPPYASGSLFNTLAQNFSVKNTLSPEMLAKLDFQERIQKGFQLALRDGVDIIGAIASILVKMGEGISGHTQTMKFSFSMLHPKILSRLVRAWLRSKRERRPMLPMDLWAPRGIIVSGMDTTIYKDAVAHYWGREMYETYSMTEAMMMATQGWNRKGMTFLPDVAFLEFIPCEERIKDSELRPGQPPTVLIHELKEGKLYELVITQFFGMPLLRYRTKDIIKVVALRDEEAGINLPQIEFQRRADETINLAALCQLDEKTLWRTIANTGIKYADWTACKEYESNQSFLRLYLELKEERQAAEVETLIDEQLKVVDVDYRDVGSYLNFQPVRVTLLSPGTFQRYIEEKQKEGADLAHMKPNHVNAPEAVIRHLLQLSEEAKEK